MSRQNKVFNLLSVQHQVDCTVVQRDKEVNEEKGCFDNALDSLSGFDIVSQNDSNMSGSLSKKYACIIERRKEIKPRISGITISQELTRTGVRKTHRNESSTSRRFR